jgi:hypothetical protein
MAWIGYGAAQFIASRRPGMLVALAVAAALAQEPPADDARRVRGIANGRLALVGRISTDPDLVKAVADKNKDSESSGEVKKRDQEWQRNPDFPLRRSASSGECAERLRALVQEDALISEAYLMDNRGTVVCSNSDLPDSWQGDEPNFQRTFGQSQFVFVGDPAPDADGGGWTVPISMVVMDGPSKAGAATVTLRVPPVATPEPAATPTPSAPPATPAP